jgi:hypothetical protein
MLKEFDLPACVAALPPGAILENHIIDSMLLFIRVTDRHPIVNRILNQQSTAEYITPSGSTIGPPKLKVGGGGGGGGGGGVIAPPVLAVGPPGLAVAVGGGGHAGGGHAGGGGIKRNAAGTPMEVVKWLRLCPCPGHRICWNWARGIPPCTKKGNASVCQAAGAKQQHQWPAGVDKKSFLNWLAQKP